MFDALIWEEGRHVVFKFGGSCALFDLFHVAFLCFVRFQKVFGCSSGVKPDKRGEFA